MKQDTTFIRFVDGSTRECPIERRFIYMGEQWAITPDAKHPLFKRVTHVATGAHIPRILTQDADEAFRQSMRFLDDMGNLKLRGALRQLHLQIAQ